MLTIRINEKKYGSKVLYENVNMTLENGVYLLKGENASGKTTLLNILYSLDKDYIGEVCFNDKNIEEIPLDIYHSNYISYLKQEFNLFTNLTINENIELLIQKYEKDTFNELVRGLNIETIVDSNKKIKEFSGGQIQKIGVLISLLSQTPILLLDEPENSLDIETINFLSTYLLSMNKLVIISSHILSEMLEEKRVNIIKIENKKIKLIENVKYENTELKIFIKNLEINESILEKLVNQFSIQRKIIIFTSILLLFLSFLITINFVTGIGLYANYNNSVDNVEILDDNVVEIYSPFLNSLFSIFGDEDAIDKIPFYFGNKEYEYLKSREDISYIEPIGYPQGSTYHTTYETDISIDTSKLDFQKYGVESSFEGVSLVQQASCIESKRVNEHGTNFCSGVDDLIYGEYPEDDTNEILLDTSTAVYYAEENNMDSLQDIVGNSFEYNIKNNDTGKKEKIKFTISGIVNSNSGPIFVTAFKHRSHEDYVNHPWLDVESGGLQTPKEYEYMYVKSYYEGTDISMPTIDEFPELKNNAYPGFYIEMNSKDDVANFVEEVREYEPFIIIESNYSKENTPTFLGLKKFFKKNILAMSVSSLLFILIVFLITKYYIKNLNKEIEKFQFFGFSKKEIQKYNKVNIKKLNKGLGIIIVINIIISVCMLVLGISLLCILINILYTLLYFVVIQIGLKFSH